MIIVTLYDTTNRTLLGKGGKWVKAEEFHRSAPEKPEDLKPSDDKKKQDPDPGPRYCCIDGSLFVCYGNTCFDLGIPC